MNIYMYIPPNLLSLVITSARLDTFSPSDDMRRLLQIKYILISQPDQDILYLRIYEPIIDITFEPMQKLCNLNDLQRQTPHLG